MGKGRRKKEENAQVTVFFAMTLALICALLLAIWESARVQCARLYFTQAVNSSMDSLFSQYHRDLWKNYRLLGLEHYQEEQLTDEAKQFLTPYLAAGDWYPLEQEELTVEDLELLTDRNGEWFEKEVLEYMRYGVWDGLWDDLTAERMLVDIEEAAALDQVSDLYEGHAKEAARLEEAIEAIVRELRVQEEDYASALDAVSALSGYELIRLLREMDPPLAKLPGLVSAYEQKAERLKEALQGSRARYEEKKEDLSSSVRETIESDIREYESYVEADGSRRQEIAAFPARAETNRVFLSDLVREAEEIQDYIDSWEPEDEDDELDEEALWEPVHTALLRYDLILFGGAAGVADKEKEGFLEQVGDLMKGNLLELLLPADAKISKAELPLSQCPSETCFDGGSESRLALTDRVLMGEYTLKTLHYYGRDRYGDHPEKKGSGHAETEYVLNGRSSDYENLSDTVSAILAIREGVNLIYLYSDSAKRAEARNLALLITGAAGFTPLITVMTFFILGVWAFGQALCDVRDLLCGKQVPFMHDKESFYLSLSGLLSIGQSKGKLAETGPGDRGLTYKEYLRILLFKDQSSLYEYRMMDMIQMNVRSSQKDFLLNRCVYSLKLSAKAKTKHVLFLMGMLRAYVDAGTGYLIETESFCRY